MDVRSSFQLSYQELAEIDAQLFQFLGLLPGDFATAVAAALADLEPETTAAALERLVDAQLLEAINEDRYQLHDLIRLFAQEQLDQTQPGEAQKLAKRRVAEWYWEGAAAWNNVFDPVRRRQWVRAGLEAAAAAVEADTLADWEQRALRAGLSWFEVERANLLTVCHWLDELQEWGRVVSFAANLAPFYNVRAYWNDWVETHQLALTAARKAKDLRGEGQTLNNLGLVYQFQGRWGKAIQLYEQDLQICRELGDRQGEGTTLMHLGNVYRVQGRWTEAIQLYEQSL